ncbi:MAG: DUF756 domain-containing protein [Actinobacteria bacterium]|nr:DUF756 domain-containing protein [Actinomycetota bacterium]
MGSLAPRDVDGDSSAQWNVITSAGRYDVELHGPSGFLRAFAGTTGSGAAVTSRLDHEHHRRTLELMLSNNDRAAVTFVLTPNDHRGDTRSVRVDGGRSVRVDWPAPDGWYDVTVTAGTALTYRYAGKIE